MIRAEEIARVAEEANQGLVIYDKLPASAGPINEVLDRAAAELAQGGDSHAVKQRAYEEVRSKLLAEAKELLSDLRECAEKGLIQLGEGNQVLPLPRVN